MLFKHRFHPGIRDGSIVLTYRTWPAARAPDLAPQVGRETAPFKANMRKRLAKS